MAGVRIATVKKLGLLRQIAEGAKGAASALKDALLAAQAAIINAPTFRSGRIVVSQSGSGQSGSFQIGFVGAEWTPENVAGLTEELLQLVEQCTVRDGMTDDGNPENTEVLRLAIVGFYNSGDVPEYGIRSQMGDFSMLNCE